MENTIVPAKVICFSNTCGTGYYYSIIEYTLIHLTHFFLKKSFYSYDVFMDKYALNAL